MAFIPFAPGVVEVHINGFLDGIPCQNVLGAKFVTGAATAIDGTALLNSIHTFMVGANWYTHLTTNYIEQGLEAIDLTSASGWTAAVGTVVPGTNAGAPTQSQVAMVVTLQTAKRGRSYRGRNFVAGLPATGLLDTKTWNTGTIAVWNEIYADLVFAIQTAGWTPVVLSRIQDKVPLAEGITTPIASVRANEKLGTIRGRLT